MKLIEEVKEYKVLPEGGRASYVFINYLLISQYAVVNKKWPLDEIHVLSNCKDHNAKWYRFYNGHSRFERELERFKTHPELLNELYEEITSYADAMVQEFSGVAWSKLTDQELVQKVKNFCEHYYKVLRSSTILRILDLALIPALRKNIDDSKADEVIRTVSVSDIPSYILQEEIALLSLISEKGSDISESDLISIIDKYAWIELGYFNEKPKTADYYLKKIKEISKDQASKQLQEIKSKQKTLLEQRDAVVATLSEEAKILAHIAAFSTHVKDHFKYSINRVTYFAEPMFQEIARRLSKGVEHIKDFTPEEVIRLLQGEKVDEKMYFERLKHHVLVCFKGKFYILVGKDAEQFETQYLSIDHVQKNELKGRVASKGNAKGVAKVVLNPDQFNKFEEGNILVVTNTSPDFTLIMKKAAAIVAEEGGLTAHVSVVSREMGVPAIVGVHHATSIIKDGDLVEVDAEKGIVKILK